MSSILLPTYKANQETKSGGDLFWKDYWESEGNKIENLYNARLTVLKESLLAILPQSVNDEDLMYAQIQLDQGVTSKSKQPKLVLEKSNIEIVGSSENKSNIIAGTSKDFKRLSTLIQSANYSMALSGSGNIGIISRELHAMHFISTLSNVFEDKLDIYLKNQYAIDSNAKVDCILELYSSNNISFSKYEEIFRQLEVHLPANSLKKRDRSLFVYNMSYLASIKLESLKNCMLNIPAFQSIHKIRHITNYTSSRSVSTIGLSNINLGAPHTNLIVGIFDSGIQHPLLNNLEFAKEKEIGHQLENKEHGTFVCSRLIFGHDVLNNMARNPTGEVTPLAKYLNVQILGELPQNKVGILPNRMDEVQKKIIEVLSRYKDNIHIYNFSIGSNEEINESEISELTQLIDQKSIENDVLIVVSAGNHDLYGSEDYEKLFSNVSLSTKVLSPGDALNVLTVGSITEKDQSECIAALGNYPSPFTRKGGFRKNYKKPELVSFGGNVAKDSSRGYQDQFMQASTNNHGVIGLSTSELSKDIGTSFSTPLVTREAILIWDYLIKNGINKYLDLQGNRLNMIKTLLIHSTNFQEHIDFESKDFYLAYGFGVPSFKNLFNDDENSVTIVYCDNIIGKKKIQRLLFKIPEYLKSENAEVIFTFSYNPPTNKNFSEYKMVDMEATVRIPYKEIDPKTHKIITKHSTIKPKAHELNYKEASFNVINFHHKNKKGFNSELIEVLISATLHSKHEEQFKNREDEFQQHYALAITIKDKSESSKLRSEILNINEFVQLVEIESETTSEVEIDFAS